MNKAKTMWPVMLTPFTASGSVDYPALGRLIEWYEKNGADGLFADCQSSEVFYLSLQERVEIAAFIKKNASIPVIASGHVSYSLDDQADELRRITDTGADAVILITNRLAPENAEPQVWMDNLNKLVSRLDPEVPLGFYECPMPYKRLLSLSELRVLARNPRFRFIKDTCCDIGLIRQRMEILRGSGLGLYNANTATLLDSLRAGAAGYSGIMANIHPDLYARLLRTFADDPETAETLQAFLSMTSLIENCLYPVCAKYDLVKKGIFSDIYTRTVSHHKLTPLIMEEIDQLEKASDAARAFLKIKFGRGE